MDSEARIAEICRRTVSEELNVALAGAGVGESERRALIEALEDRLSSEVVRQVAAAWLAVADALPSNAATTVALKRVLGLDHRRQSEAARAAGLHPASLSRAERRIRARLARHRLMNLGGW